MQTTLKRIGKVFIIRWVAFPICAKALCVFSFKMATIVMLRGGVEDTRLEAKAKDTKKSEAKAKDSLSEDRHSRGQGQGPRTQSASALQKKKKKKVFTKIFQAISTKKRFPKNFSTAPQNFNFQKNSAVLEPRTGQFSRT